jgi:hypothetical protein
VETRERAHPLHSIGITQKRRGWILTECVYSNLPPVVNLKQEDPQVLEILTFLFLKQMNDSPTRGRADRFIGIMQRLLQYRNKVMTSNMTERPQCDNSRTRKRIGRQAY